MKIKFLDLKDFNDTFNVSGLEVVEDQFYFISADGEEVLLTNKKGDTEDRFAVKHSAIHEALDSAQTKTSATVIIRDGKNPAFLLLGSGKDESSAWGLKINLKSRLMEEIDLSSFYNRIREAGVQNLDIKSATILNDKVVLCNNANEQEPGGLLIVSDADFWKKPASCDITITHLQWDKLTEKTIAVSAIFYSYQNDWLIATGNAEVASGEQESGLEREVFMGVVENAYRKMDRKRIKVNEFFDLASEDKAFKNQTIRSIAIQDDKEKKIKIHMLGDDNRGGNSLIKLRLKYS